MQQVLVMNSCGRRVRSAPSYRQRRSDHALSIFTRSSGRPSANHPLESGVRRRSNLAAAPTLSPSWRDQPRCTDASSSDSRARATLIADIDPCLQARHFADAKLSMVAGAVHPALKANAIPLLGLSPFSSRYLVPASSPAATLLCSTPMPGMSISIESPTAMGPTPAGVPVMMTSPGSRVMCRLK